MKLYLNTLAILSIIVILLTGVKLFAYDIPLSGNTGPGHLKKKSKYFSKRKVLRKRRFHKRRVKKHRLRRKYRKRRVKRKHSVRYKHRKRHSRTYQSRKRRQKRYTRRKRNIKRYRLSKRLSKKRRIKRRRRWRLKRKRYLARRSSLRRQKINKRRDMVKVKYRAKIHKVRIPKALRQKLARTNLQDYSERLSTLEFDRYIDDDRKQVSSNKKATKQIVQIQRKANLNFLQRIFGKVSFDDSSYDQDLITLNEQDKPYN